MVAALTLNHAVMTTTTTGVGTITLGEAWLPFQTLSAAGAVDQATYSYAIEDLAGGWETGWGVYTASGTTLTRNLDQSSTGSLLNLSGAARVSIITRAGDYPQVIGEQRPSGVNNVTFSVPGGFRDLQLVVRARSLTAANSDALLVQYNGDTGSNYDWVKENRFGTGGNNGVTSGQVGDIQAASATASYFSGINATIFDYLGTNSFKAGYASYEFIQSQSVAGMFQEINGFWWRSTAAITSIKLFTNSGSNFAANSWFSLRGLP